MKRFFGLLLMLSFMMCTVLAQHTVVIQFKDGTKQLYNTSDVESISFDPEVEEILSVTAAPASDIKVDQASVIVTIDTNISLDKLSEAGLLYATSEELLSSDPKKLSTTSVGTALRFQLSSLTSGTKYYYKAYVTYNGENVYSTVSSFTTPDTKFPVANFVDLGLSVKWAEWNMGASSVTDRGGYYGWGDPTGELYSSSSSDYAKGNTNSNIAGTEYDLAHVQWGGKWRMPTAAEIKELESLEWNYEENYGGSGIPGWKITAKNGKSIFLPSNGYKSPNHPEGINIDRSTYYWTSEIVDLYQPKYANFNATNFIIVSQTDKNVWMPLRPVYDDSTPVVDNPEGNDDPNDNPAAGKYVNLGLSVAWADINVGASTSTEYGSYFAWGETKEKSEYSTSNSDTYEQNYGSDICESTFDAARQLWGSTWRLPTQEEIRELQEQCSWQWTSKNGVNGYQVTGPNGRSIFLPAAGKKYGDKETGVGTNGYYQTGSSYTLRTDNVFSWDLEFDSSNTPNVTYCSRAHGLTIRPVHPL